MSDDVICRDEFDDVLSELFTHLWDCDVNHCEPEKHYTLDLQGNVTVLYCSLIYKLNEFSDLMLFCCMTVLMMRRQRLAFQLKNFL